MRLTPLILRPRQIRGEFLFYFGIGDRFFDRVTVTTPEPVSQPHSRKSFFGRIGALFAASVFAPKRLAKSATKAVVHPSGGTPFRLKAESRAVARDADSL